MERGWSIVRGLVPAHRADELAREALRIFPQAVAPANRPHELPSPSSRNETFRAQSRDAALGRHAAELLGCDEVQLLQDTLLVKPALSDARVEWHQDHTYTGFLDPAAVVSIRIALTPCTRASGCLEVIDGSERWGPLEEVRALTAARVDDESAHFPAGWEARRTPLELAPGDASLHHCLTVHGSGANTTAGPRITLIVRLFDARCRLLPDRLPDASLRRWFPTDPEGRLSRASFPLV